MLAMKSPSLSIGDTVTSWFTVHVFPLCCFFVHMATNLGSLWWRCGLSFHSPHVFQWSCTQPSEITNSKSSQECSISRDVAPKFQKMIGLFIDCKGSLLFCWNSITGHVLRARQCQSLKRKTPPRKGSWWLGVGPETDLNLPFSILIWGQRPQPKWNQGKEVQFPSTLS